MKVKNLILQAIYSIPKLDLNEYCKTNGTTLEELYEAVENYPDENVKYLFFNRYPREVNEEDLLSGENIIKQILKIKHIKIGEISDTYHVSRRWIFRILKKVQSDNPKLYDLYKKFRKGELTPEEEKTIENMSVSEISSERLKSIKGYSPKPRETEAIFKSEEQIREEIYEKVAEDCEDVEEFMRKIKSEDVETIIANRIKKQDIVVKLFEGECNHNLSELDMKLQQREIRKRILEEFKKIDEEDGIEQIYAKKYKEDLEEGKI